MSGWQEKTEGNGVKICWITLILTIWRALEFRTQIGDYNENIWVTNVKQSLSYKSEIMSCMEIIGFSPSPPKIDGRAEYYFTLFWSKKKVLQSTWNMHLTPVWKFLKQSCLFLAPCGNTHGKIYLGPIYWELPSNQSNA